MTPLLFSKYILPTSRTSPLNTLPLSLSFLLFVFFILSLFLFSLSVFLFRLSFIRLHLNRVSFFNPTFSPICSICPILLFSFHFIILIIYIFLSLLGTLLLFLFFLHLLSLYFTLSISLSYSLYLTHLTCAPYILYVNRAILLCSKRNRRVSDKNEDFFFDETTIVWKAFLLHLTTTLITSLSLSICLKNTQLNTCAHTLPYKHTHTCTHTNTHTRSHTNLCGRILKFLPIKNDQHQRQIRKFTYAQQFLSLSRIYHFFLWQR